MAGEKSASHQTRLSFGSMRILADSSARLGQRTRIIPDSGMAQPPDHRTVPPSALHGRRLHSASAGNLPTVHIRRIRQFNISSGKTGTAADSRLLLRFRSAQSDRQKNVSDGTLSDQRLGTHAECAHSHNLSEKRSGTDSAPFSVSAAGRNVETSRDDFCGRTGRRIPADPDGSRERKGNRTKRV